MRTKMIEARLMCARCKIYRWFKIRPEIQSVGGLTWSCTACGEFVVKTAHQIGQAEKR